MPMHTVRTPNGWAYAEAQEPRMMEPVQVITVDALGPTMSVSLLMTHDEATKLCLNSLGMVLAGHRCSPAMTLREAGAVVASLQGEG